MYRKSAVVSKSGKISFANNFFRIAATTAATAGLLLLAACPGDDEGETPVGPTTKVAVDTGWYTKDPEATIFNISTAAQLAGLAELVNERRDNFNGKTIYLTKDIDLSAYGSNYRDGKGWLPIGYYDGGRGPFVGTFDGNGHIVSGVWINDNTRWNAGLFGCAHAEIRNIGVENVNIRANSCVGGVVGGAGGNVINCYSTGTVKGIGNNVGGVVGLQAGATITGCYSSCTVTGDNKVGGVVGSNEDRGNIKRCYSIGAVNGSNEVGGVLGYFTGLYDASMDWSAALNPSVKATGNAIGRVVSNNYYYRSENTVAFAGIINDGGNTAWEENLKLNGIDITAAEIASDGTLGGRFTEDWGWTVQNGKLPGLFGKTVDIPDHLKQ
jgi:hypothetical protein